MKKFKKVTAIALAVSFATATIAPQAIQPLPTIQAATKIKLNKTKATIKVGKTVQLKVKGTKKKVKWTSNNTRIAKVSAKGKVTGKKAGNAKITAKVSGKKLTCKIKVVKPAPTKKPTPKPTATPTIKPTATPNNTPNETATPKPSKNPATKEPESPNDTSTPTPDSGKQVSLNLDFYLGAYDPEAPNEQFVNVYFANHLDESVFVESEAYVTTRGEKYPALISYTKLGEKKEIQPTNPEDTYGERVEYDSLDYVLNGSDCTMLWLPLDENSTLTFFFNIGDKRYKAVITFDQKGAIYREATDSEQLEPFETVAPFETETPAETEAPVQTEEPIDTMTPFETEPPVQTPAPEPKKLEDLNVEFYLEPYNPDETEKIYFYVYYSNHTNETVFIEKDAYFTTRGTNYPLALDGTFDKDYFALNPDTLDEGYPLSFSKIDIDGIPVDENSTLTFFFRIGDKRYKATINYDEKGGIYYDADETEPLTPFETTAPFETVAPSETETPVETEEPVETATPSAEPTATPEPKEPVSMNLDFYLGAYDPEAPDHQFVDVYFANHLDESVFVESEAYVTTRGENYPALITNTKLGEQREIKPTYPSDTEGEQVTYDSMDYVLNDIDCTMWWLPLDENSTLTFFFRTGGKRYKATINYNQKGGLYYEADDTEQLTPLITQDNTQKENE